MLLITNANHAACPNTTMVGSLGWVISLDNFLSRLSNFLVIATSRESNINNKGNPKGKLSRKTSRRSKRCFKIDFET